MTTDTSAAAPEGELCAHCEKPMTYHLDFPEACWPFVPALAAQAPAPVDGAIRKDALREQVHHEIWLAGASDEIAAMRKEGVLAVLSDAIARSTADANIRATMFGRERDKAINQARELSDAWGRASVALAAQAPAPVEGETREAVKAAIRRAFTEGLRDVENCRSWSEDVLLTGCRRANGGRGYEKPDEAADNLTSEAADAICALFAPLLAARERGGIEKVRGCRPALSPDRQCVFDYPFRAPGDTCQRCGFTPDRSLAAAPAPAGEISDAEKMRNGCISAVQHMTVYVGHTWDQATVDAAVHRMRTFDQACAVRQPSSDASGETEGRS